ncbi:MAG: diguanylate cyclase [Deltaproteobacteria bacterium]|nr:diguanylate cyclase [Deltaproteobacteria bacterium]
MSKAQTQNDPDYASFFRAVPIGLYRTTAEGRITDVNPALLRMLGYTQKDEFIMLDASELYVDPEDQKRWRRMIREKGVVVNFEVRLRHRDGHMLWVRENSRAIRDAEGRVQRYEGSMEDITGQKAIQEQLLNQTRLLNAVNRLFQETLTCNTETEVAATCLRVAEEITRSRFGFIGEINTDNRLDTFALSDPGWQACRMADSKASRMIRDMDIRGIWGRVLTEGCSLITNRPDTHPDRVGTPEGHPVIHSFLGVPLKLGGRTMGIIGLANKKPGYQQEDLEHIEQLSHAFLVALERKRTEETLAESEAQFRAIAAMAHDAIVMTDTRGRIVYWNPAAETIFGYTAAEAYHQDTLDLLAPKRLREQYEAGLRDFRKSVRESAKGQTLELKAVRKDGAEFPVELSMSSVKLKDRWHTIGIVRDITSRKEMEAKLRRMSYQDGLTGVANRRHFEETLDKEWRRSARDKDPLSIIMVDIDLFKAYNDAYGHQKGDECLKQVAQCIQSGLKRPGDLAARYGGEEFVVVLPDTDMKGAMAVAEKIKNGMEALRIPHRASTVSEHVTVSQGVATGIAEPSITPESLVEAADQALYQAKKGGRNRVVEA